MLITGANSGLGKQAALELSRAGWSVVGACRSVERGEAAARELAAQGGGMTVMALDLASLASVRSFAAAFQERHSSLDVLVCNAGVMSPPERRLTEDGFELQFQTNHLGHYLLTSLLLKTLLGAPAARVVNVDSSAHLWGSTDLAAAVRCDGFFGYPALGWAAYGTSKLANVLHTYELHRRLRSAGLTRVDTNAVHPGVVDTELPRNLPVNLWEPAKAAGLIISVQDGARGHVRLASDPALAGVSGRYYSTSAAGRVDAVRSSAASYDGDAAERLWELSKDLTGADWAPLGKCA